MSEHHGPPEKSEGRDPHHRARPSTSRFSSHDTAYTQQQNTAGADKTPGSALVWLPCTWDHPQDLRSQLNRRRSQSNRSVPLDCGCRDPWPCRCTQPPLTDRALDGWRDSAAHVLETGQIPLLPLDVRRALWRRGGRDRDLAELLHDACGETIA